MSKPARDAMIDDERSKGKITLDNKHGIFDIQYRPIDAVPAQRPAERWPLAGRIGNYEVASGMGSTRAVG
jgi:hypothetical protein